MLIILPLSVSWRSLVDKCSSLGSCKPQMFLFLRVGFSCLISVSVFSFFFYSPFFSFFLYSYFTLLLFLCLSFSLSPFPFLFLLLSLSTFSLSHLSFPAIYHKKYEPSPQILNTNVNYTPPQSARKLKPFCLSSLLFVHLPLSAL